jgi:transposase InsO family protein
MGRPRVPGEVRDLIARMSRDNPLWGTVRIRGELLKLGHPVAATTVRSVLRRHLVPPAPRRAGLAWPAFLRAHARGLLACDFFGVETVRLQMLSVLFFLEVQSRRVFVAGCTAHPTAAWVTQQARDVMWAITSAGMRPTILLHDRDGKFPPAFDAVFAAERVRVVRTPPQAPRANAFAERWVGTVRRECLDWLLITGERHLKQVLCDYAEHYNRTRPHRALGLRAPLARAQAQAPARRIIRRDRLGGLIHEYDDLERAPRDLAPGRAEFLYPTADPRAHLAARPRARGCPDVRPVSLPHGPSAGGLVDPPPRPGHDRRGTRCKPRRAR